MRQTAGPCLKTLNRNKQKKSEPGVSNPGHVNQSQSQFLFSGFALRFSYPGCERLHECRCPLRPEASDVPGLQLQASGMLGMEHRSSVRAIGALNH